MRLPLPEYLFVRPAFCIRLSSDSISQWIPLPSLTVLLTRARKGLSPSSLTTYRSHSYAKSLAWQSKCVDQTGLIWMGARYYEPETGRFLSVDPISHPVNMELYNYANGDPINFYDPDGRCISSIYKPIAATVANTWTILASKGQ
jgi:RHS repeat-associated protein